MSAGTTLLEDKLNINLAATFDPYDINENGIRINKFNGNGFRMTSANINLGFTIKSKNSKDSSKESDNSRSGGRKDDLFVTLLVGPKQKKAKAVDAGWPKRKQDKFVVMLLTPNSRSLSRCAPTRGP